MVSLPINREITKTWSQQDRTVGHSKAHVIATSILEIIHKM